MNKGDTIKMANNDNSKSKSAYDLALEKFYKLRKRVNTEYKALVIELIIALKAENLDKLAIRQKLKQDLRGAVGENYIYKLVTEQFRTAAEIKAMTEKQKQEAEALVEGEVTTNDNGDTILIQKTGSGDGDKLTPQEERELLENNKIVKGTQKGSSQMQRLQKDSPTVDQSQLDSIDDDDEPSSSNTSQGSVEDNVKPPYMLEKYGNRLYIDDPKLLNDIAKIIAEKRTLFIIFRDDLTGENVEAGKPISSSKA